MISGEVKEFSEDSSSVGPDLRKALVSLSCGSAWVDADKDCDAEKFMSAFSRDLHKHGRGSYYNEPGNYNYVKIKYFIFHLSAPVAYLFWYIGNTSSGTLFHSTNQLR